MVVSIKGETVPATSFLKDRVTVLDNCPHAGLVQASQQAHQQACRLHERDMVDLQPFAIPGKPEDIAQAYKLDSGPLLTEVTILLP